MQETHREEHDQQAAAAGGIGSRRGEIRCTGEAPAFLVALDPREATRRGHGQLPRVQR